MTNSLSLNNNGNFVIERAQLSDFINLIKKQGYQPIGPTVRDGAIVYDQLNSDKDLPIGWTDDQSAGTYRIIKSNDDSIFNYTVGPQFLKRFLYPPGQRLWQAKRESNTFQIIENKEDFPKYAFIGVRSCDIHAVSILDTVLLGGKYIDPNYKLRRENILIIAINCGKAGGTCFCASMKTGPKATDLFDIALTEILESNHHYFLAEIRTNRGEKILQKIKHRKATIDEQKKADEILVKVSKQMGRSLDTSNIKELLYRNYDHPRWEQVATRCLTCANCTIVCPTCFCANVEETTDLTGENAERWRKWDSCFTINYSYIYGGSVRSSIKSRYRQWLTHKLATWLDQFGTSGCVGCGRCITWCPVGIDITEEVRSIRESESIGKASS